MLLSRPGAPAGGHYRPKESRTGVPRRGHCKPKRGPFPNGDIESPNSNTGFGLSLAYATDKVVLFLAAPILFSTLIPFVVCRERRAIFLRGEVDNGRKDQAFRRPSSSGTHHVIAYSKHTQTHWSRCAQLLTPVLGTGRSKMPCNLAPTPIFRQNQAIKNHLWSSDNKPLAESSPLDAVWGNCLRADDPKINNPCQWRANNSSMRHFLPFAKLFPTVRSCRHTRPPLVGSAPALRLQEPRNFVRAAAGSFTAGFFTVISPCTAGFFQVDNLTVRIGAVL